METIRIFVEDLLTRWGVAGETIALLRHVILIATVILLALATYQLCRRILVPVVERITRHTSVTWDDTLFGHPVLVAACRIVPACVVWQLLPMVFYQYPVMQEALVRLTAIYLTITTAHLFTVFIDSFKLLQGKANASLRQYMLSFCGLLKVVIIFIAVIVVIAVVLGRNPLSLLAGLGATSAILMLVFKDTIEGLVAGIRLTSADMMHVGDWITVPSTKADGIVTEMTLTTVKVQNFDNTIITVSPTALVNGSFQNWKGMQAAAGRRVSRKVYIDFQSIHFTNEEHTETNLTRFRTDMEQFLASRPEVNPDMTLMVRQLEATQSGLPIEFYFFLRQKEWTTYEHQLAAIMEYAYALATEYGLEIYRTVPKP